MGLKRVRVEVVQAFADDARQVTVDLDQGATIEQALRATGRCDALTPDSKVGVFGRLRNLDDCVQDGDRVEIYRPLLADPKAARRARAAKRPLRGAARRG